MYISLIFLVFISLLLIAALGLVLDSQLRITDNLSTDPAALFFNEILSSQVFRVQNSLHEGCPPGKLFLHERIFVNIHEVKISLFL